MKPIRLEIEGLRSFRTKREIPFDGLELFAILGDTGAGKTSILEAITYALFNRSTWSGRNVRELLSKGAKTMTVTFVFSVDGDEFTVTRILKSGAGASQHRLRCQVRGIDVESEENVNEAVRVALHLDDEAFLHTVLLPQGKHADLLTATGTKRSDILSELFRLDELADVAQLAKSFQFRADGLLQTFAQQRNAIVAEPDTALTQAETRVAAAEKRLATVNAAVEAIAAIERSLADSAGALVQLRQRAAQLEAVRDVDVTLTDLRDTDEKLSARRQELHSELDRARAAKSDAEKALRALKKSGLDSASVHGYAAVLDLIESLAAEIARERKQLDENVRFAGEKREALEETQAETLLHEKAMKGASQAVADAEASLEKLRPKLATLQERKAKHDAAVAARDQSGARLAACSAELVGADDRLGAADALVKSAMAEFERATEVLELERTADSVAALASHLHAGDLCPVCERKLPSTFVPPVSAGLGEAKKTEEAANASLRKAEIAKGKLERLIESQRTSEKKARDEVEQHEAAVVEAFNAFCAAADRKGEEPAASMQRIAASIGELQNRIPALRKGLDDARAEFKAADKRGVALDTEAKGYEATAARLRGSLGERETALQTRVKELPAAFSPGTDLKALATAREAVTASLNSCEKIDASLKAAAAEIDAASEAIAQVDRERTASVSIPRSRLFERLETVAKLLVREGCPPEEEQQGLWSAGVIAAADDERERMIGRCAAEEAGYAELEERRAAIVSELETEPGKALASATSELQAARVALAAARAALETATQLANRIRKLEPVREGLFGLRQALGANAFPAYATQQRQMRLLEIGSMILSDMTEGRYSFTNDFSIFDQEANDARSAQTLSGGEKFLASLALSLAVVEIASSAGAKIESLFLDEGFASLDAETLETAMMELRKRSRAGRKICVISHLAQVTQFVNDTLLVEAADEGSRVTRIAGPLDGDSDLVEGLVNQLMVR